MGLALDVVFDGKTVDVGDFLRAIGSDFMAWWDLVPSSDEEEEEDEESSSSELEEDEVEEELSEDEDDEDVLTTRNDLTTAMSPPSSSFISLSSKSISIGSSRDMVFKWRRRKKTTGMQHERQP
jgi:hypothetical protein